MARTESGWFQGRKLIDIFDQMQCSKEQPLLDIGKRAKLFDPFLPEPEIMGQCSLPTEIKLQDTR